MHKTGDFTGAADSASSHSGAMVPQEPAPPTSDQSLNSPTAPERIVPGTVVVAGATGTIGVPLLAALRKRGFRVSPIARSLGVDLTTGKGLTAAMADAEAVVDVSSIATTSRARAVRFFEQTTHRLLAAAQDGGDVRHYVILSIIGTDQIASGYYQGKRLQEQIVGSAELPHTILRATQFHEFAEQMLNRMRVGPATFIPVMLCQPVAAVEVADQLAEIVSGGPPLGAGGAEIEFAGPEQIHLPEMVRRYQRHIGDRHLVVPLSLPTRSGHRMRTGGLLPHPGASQGTITFDQWLKTQPGFPERAPGRPGHQ